MVKKNKNSRQVFRHIEVEQKVPFHDLDPMQVVWHGNYYKYFDVARFELFKAAGIDLYEYTISKQVSFPVSRTAIKHIAPLRYHDEFICKAVVTEAEYKIAMSFEIRLKNTGQVCARGKSEQVAVVVPDMILQYRIPEDITSSLLWFDDMLLSHLDHTDTDKITAALAIGYERVAAWADLLDQINVFPVHDSDTGKNLKISLAPFKLLHPDKEGRGRPATHSLDELTQKLLRSAIGNSGNIAAAFFSGFLAHPLPVSFPAAARQGFDQAKKAVATPRPGTMLDLLESLADFFDEQGDASRLRKGQFDTDELTCKLKQSVEESPTRLPILEKAKVVDAGALGMFLFLEVFFKALENRTDQCIPVMESFKGLLSVCPEYREPPQSGFCVNLQVGLPQGCTTVSQDLIPPLGDSVVLSQTDRSLKLHIHTRDREMLKQQISEVGSILTWDDEPIRSRSNATLSRTHPDTVGIITDAAGSITLDRASELGIILMDSFIVTDDGSCPETLADPADIYAAMDRGQRVMTAQASVFQRQEIFRKAMEQYGSVLYLCVGSVYTNNYAVASQWVEENKLSRRMRVIDTGAASGRLGLIAETVSLAAGFMQDLDALTAYAYNTIGACDELLFLNQLKYLAMGGRMSRTGSRMGDLFSIRPVISPRADGAKKVGTVRNSAGQIRFALNRLEQNFNSTACPRILLEYSDNREWLETSVMPKIIQTCARAHVSLIPLSLTSGVHMGPGTWGIAFLTENLADNDPDKK